MKFPCEGNPARPFCPADVTLARPDPSFSFQRVDFALPFTALPICLCHARDNVAFTAESRGLSTVTDTWWDAAFPDLRSGEDSDIIRIQMGLKRSVLNFTKLKLE